MICGNIGGGGGADTQPEEVRPTAMIDMISRMRASWPGIVLRLMYASAYKLEIA